MQENESNKKWVFSNQLTHIDTKCLKSCVQESLHKQAQDTGELQCSSSSADLHTPLYF